MQRIIDYIISLDRPPRHIAFRMFQASFNSQFTEADKFLIIRSLVAAYFCVDASSVVVAQAARHHMAPELTSVEVVDHLGPHRLRSIAEAESSPVREWLLQESGSVALN